VRNPRNAGLVFYDRKVVDRDGRAHVEREILWDVKPPWKPIVSRAKWERVCAVLDERGASVRKPKGRNALSGRYTCDRCDAPMISNTDMHRGGAKRWACKKRFNYRDVCGSNMIQAEATDAYVLAWLFSEVDRRDFADLVAQFGRSEEESSAIAAELVDVEGDLAEVAEAIENPTPGGVRTSVWRERERKLVVRRAELRAELGQEADAAARVLAPYAGKEGALKRAWPKLTIEQQRAILDVVCAEVRIVPKPVDQLYSRGWSRLRVRLPGDDE
jgi:recombinase-like zinc beta ribbon protein